VSKIKALQTQVDTLQAQLSERPPVGPPDETSSDGSEKSTASGNFVKVSAPASTSAREAELAEREAALLRREEAAQQREEAAQQREEALRLREEAATQPQQTGAEAAGVAWHAALLAGLREVEQTCAQVELACESAGVA
jgi:hypothetical protein